MIAEARAGNKLKKKGVFYYLKRDFELYLLLLLPVVYYVVFKYVPMYGVTIAFKDYNMFKGILASDWVGLDVFKEIFQMKNFYTVVRNTFLINGFDLLLGFPAPVLLAILLNEIRSVHFKKISQTVLYLPHFLSWVIIGGIAYQIFATQSGMINTTLRQMGFESIPFLTEKWHWLFTYVGIGIWQSMGWGTIIYLAAITGINSELYEAAEVDGASRLQKIWHITIPGIMSTIVIMLILRMGQIITIGFDRPYVLGNPLVTDFSEVISTFTYHYGLKAARYSLATAVGLFQSVIGIIFLTSTNAIAKKCGETGIW
ncbi:MAG: sugar ABC transporter permease [Provencibacterium sp.]|jgi:putative aldouronate transport system permease protein|nr:sugar ABC transporter permease [Provencibacterium sp.]